MVNEIEENLEGFEELESKPQEAQQGQGVNRPDIRIVQVESDREGKAVYKNVGGMWKNISKNGNEFYTIKIGNLKLLAFPNTQK
ncbi:MAG: hypothetical protein WC501_05670 [Candidatus Micrarchaeia archaeon]|jgi:uncharacterized protein (DUF736 family)